MDNRRGASPTILISRPITTPYAAARRSNNRIVQQIINTDGFGACEPVTGWEARHASLFDERFTNKPFHADRWPQDGHIHAINDARLGCGKIELPYGHVDIRISLVERLENLRHQVDTSTNEESYF